MSFTVHCPGCHASLRVPEETVGRSARCSVCRTKFVIPSPDEVFEDTVSHWIEEDLEQFLDEDDEQSTAARGDEQPPEARAEKPDRGEDEEEEGGARRRVRRPVAPKAASQLTSGDTVYAQAVGEPVDEAGGGGGVEESAEEGGGGESGGDEAEGVGGDLSGGAAKSGAGDKDESSGFKSHAGARQLMGSYPTDLHVTEPIPRLVVGLVAQQGIEIHFDSIWLEHEGFRGAMPARCVFSGERDAKTLIARPLVFLDRSRDASATTKEVEEGHTHPLRNIQSGAVVSTLGRLEKMPSPFDSPVPYYTTQKYQHAVLECGTEKRSDGGYTCKVRVPDGEAALEWLGNVNGVCGMEYALLERDLASMHSEEWNELDDRVKQRIAVWCKFEPGERFKHYLPDADLAKHDGGLAGIVVTSGRLIFHKYHRHGEVSLHEESTLLVKRKENMADLLLERGERRYKLGKLRSRDLSKMVEAMSHAPRINIQMSAARPGE